MFTMHGWVTEVRREVQRDKAPHRAGSISGCSESDVSMTTRIAAPHRALALALLSRYPFET